MSTKIDLIQQNTDCFGINIGTQTLNGKIIILTGINGCGKSRLIECITSKNIKVLVDGESVDRILMYDIKSIEPKISNQINTQKFFNLVEETYVIYKNIKDSLYFDEKGRPNATDRMVFQSAFGNPNININIVLKNINHICKKYGKNPDEITESEFYLNYTNNYYSLLGEVNIRNTFREYLEKLERNKYNNFLNIIYDENKPYLSDEQLLEQIGIAPWDLLNKSLDIVFDGQYRVTTPVSNKPEDYNPEIIKNSTRSIVNPDKFSSGEKVLLWLVLCMYTMSNDGLIEPPNLLLLDEPDATLHPGIIDKFHKTIRLIQENFNCTIIYSTHSPTTVALSESDSIYRVSENRLERISLDKAVSELLVGVNKIAIDYSNRRTVYVESKDDVDVYEEIYSNFCKWNILSNNQISLSFIPAGPSVSEKIIRDVASNCFVTYPSEEIEAFIKNLNGQGCSTQVVGKVESLLENGNKTVHGIIDWDATDKNIQNIHVHGAGIFYSMENVLLNPLTLGIFIVINHKDKAKFITDTLPCGYDNDDILNSNQHWQSIANAVTCKVMQDQAINLDMECEFIGGFKLRCDKRYFHYQGHDLEKSLIKGAHAFPFLWEVKKEKLAYHVLTRIISYKKGQFIPKSFLNLFESIRNG